ncbi:MAG: protein-L-isoaspartate O-methyltransferase [Proteobacteria bacterium]|nr:protein-L-isoaspartate O-methyltransferase [Pseudomonadota bacterium]
MHTTAARVQMIEQQVRAWDVLDARVLAAMGGIAREAFVPPGEDCYAYADAEVPLPHGQHMLRPSVAGRLLQALELQGGERVLEIGTGTGFVTACLRALSAQVRSLEIFADLAAQARANLARLGLTDIEVMEADALLQQGTQQYDAIAVTGSLPVYDPRFERLLADGGRLFIVVGAAPAMEARLVRRSGTRFDSAGLFETVIDPLVNAAQPPRFRF